MKTNLKWFAGTQALTSRPAVTSVVTRTRYFMIRLREGKW
jgi:hypothetical protein